MLMGKDTGDGSLIMASALPPYRNRLIAYYENLPVPFCRLFTCALFGWEDGMAVVLVWCVYASSADPCTFHG